MTPDDLAPKESSTWSRSDSTENQEVGGESKTVSPWKGGRNKKRAKVVLESSELVSAAVDLDLGDLEALARCTAARQELFHIEEAKLYLNLMEKEIVRLIEKWKKQVNKN